MRTAPVPVCILKESGRDGEIVVSIRKGLEHSDWLHARTLLKSGDVFQAKMTDFNRGGVIVSFGRLRGFVPNSHLTCLRSRKPEAKSKPVGQSLSLVVLEVDQRRRHLVLSERAANYPNRQQLLGELSEGEVRTGIVRSLVDFGAFVDLDGVDGLIHISELDWRYVDKACDVLSVGDEVQVLVLRVDREQERIALSRKRLLPNPWERVTKNLMEGDVVKGTVTGVVSFGAFVDIGEGSRAWSMSRRCLVAKLPG